MIQQYVSMLQQSVFSHTPPWSSLTCFPRWLTSHCCHLDIFLELISRVTNAQLSTLNSQPSPANLSPYISVTNLDRVTNLLPSISATNPDRVTINFIILTVSKWSDEEWTTLGVVILLRVV